MDRKYVRSISIDFERETREIRARCGGGVCVPLMPSSNREKGRDGEEESEVEGG